MRFSRGTRLAACLLALSISLPGGLARAAESAESPLTLTEGQSVTLTLEAPQTGEYRLELEFMALTGKTVNPQATLSLGEAYRTSVTLPRLWKDLRQGDRFAVDEKGNELVPRQEELFERQTVVLPLVGGGQPVKLEAGRYTLTLTMTAKSIELYGARLVSAVGRSYAAYTEEQADKPAGETVPIYLEAELPSRKSSAGLTATFDNSSPDISPSAADRTLLGLISAGSREGQWLEWEFEAAQPGFYKLTIGYRQNSMRGLGVRRGVTLDGKPLFDELDELVFPYTESFAALTPGGESPYQIYLDKGKHTLRLTATRGQLVEPLAALDQAIDRMNKAYRDILVITGTTPDPYRDYYLEKEIPTLLDDLAWCRDTLRAGARCIEALTGGRRGSETSPIDEAVRTLDGLLEKPYLIAQRLSLYKAQIDAVANQSAYLSSQPLELDTLELLPVEEASHRRTHSLLERIGYRAAVFFQSFLKDYSSSTAVQASGPPAEGVDKRFGAADHRVGRRAGADAGAAAAVRRGVSLSGGAGSGEYERCHHPGHRVGEGARRRPVRTRADGDQSGRSRRAGRFSDDGRHRNGKGALSSFRLGGGGLERRAVRSAGNADVVHALLPDGYSQRAGPRYSGHLGRTVSRPPGAAPTEHARGRARGPAGVRNAAAAARRPGVQYGFDGHRHGERRVCRGVCRLDRFLCQAFHAGRLRLLQPVPYRRNAHRHRQLYPV